MTETNWGTVLTAVLGSGLLSTLVSQFFNWLTKRQEQKSGVAEGMRLVMKDRLRFLCAQYINQGWIYEDELEDLMAMHKCYHDKLKGNGYLDGLMERVKALDLRGIGQ